MVLKIAVYTIAKNEEAFARRWAHSCREADYRVVADTGSTDHTVALLREEGVTVHSIRVEPWRFDTARNRALALVPEEVDVCISMDMDEFLHPGWREALERVWTPETSDGEEDNGEKSNTPTFANCRFRLTWKNKPHNDIYHERIHHRKLYQWWGCVHERLVFHGGRVDGSTTLGPPGFPEPDNLPPLPVVTHSQTHKVVWAHDLWIEQQQDETKDRSSYLGLLEQAVMEDGSWWKTWFFLAEEYRNSAKKMEAEHSRLRRELCEWDESDPTTEPQRTLLEQRIRKTKGQMQTHAFRVQWAGSKCLMVGGRQVWKGCRHSLIGIMKECLDLYPAD